MRRARHIVLATLATVPLVAAQARAWMPGPEQYGVGSTMNHAIAGADGLSGPSYMGIDQFGTAADSLPDSPVKAMFPIIAANDIYRDAAFGGGFLDTEFGSWYFPLVTSLGVINPVVQGNADAVPTL